jgi:hypothetical protein
MIMMFWLLDPCRFILSEMKTSNLTSEHLKYELWLMFEEAKGIILYSKYRYMQELK